jgi:hypothetical protein
VAPRSPDIQQFTHSVRAALAIPDCASRSNDHAVKAEFCSVEPMNSLVDWGIGLMPSAASQPLTWLTMATGSWEALPMW